MNTPDVAILLAVIACCAGGALGGFALARPQDVARLVGLTDDPDRPHAMSAVRATYGGLFLASHAGAAAALGYAPTMGAVMALTLSLAWAGAGAARAWSMAVHKADDDVSIRLTIFEFVMAAALGLPFWGLLSGGPAVGAVPA